MIFALLVAGCVRNDPAQPPRGAPNAASAAHGAADVPPEVVGAPPTFVRGAANVPPEVVGAKPTFVRKDAAAKTVHLTVIATYDATNHGMNFNGYSHGKAAFIVPVGWTVKVTFKNNSDVPHSAVVVDTEMVQYPRVGEPYFAGAATPNHENGVTSETVRFQFIPDEMGRFALACGFPVHAANGHWLVFVVAGAGAEPSFGPLSESSR